MTTRAFTGANGVAGGKRTIRETYQFKEDQKTLFYREHWMQALEELQEYPEQLFFAMF